MTRRLKTLIVLAAAASALIYVGWRLREYRFSKIHQTGVVLPSGDILVHESDWWGREPFLNDSSPHMRLYIEWRSTGVKELLSDEAYVTMTPAEQCSLYRGGDITVIQTPAAIYWKRCSMPMTWQRWDIRSPKRDPLYTYLRDRAASDPSSEFREVATERGKRLALPSAFSYTWIGDTEDNTWSLPYRFGGIEIEKNRLHLVLERPVAGLPRTLYFSGPAPSFGAWEFSPTMTDEATSKQP
jgi:hypothetical protein